MQTTRFPGLSKQIWGEICSYLSVKDELRMQQCSKKTLIFFRSLDKFAPLSEKKIEELYKKKPNLVIETFFKSPFCRQPLTYKQSWFNRILKISTIFFELYEKEPYKSISTFFPNLTTLVIDSSNYAKLVLAKNKFVYKKEIKLVIEKKAMYGLGKINLSNLFYIFLKCIEITFSPSSDDQSEMNCCLAAGLVKEDIKNIFSEVVFRKGNLGAGNSMFTNIDQLNEKIRNCIKDEKKKIKLYEKKKNYGDLFVCQYFGLETRIVLKEYDYFPLALKEKNPHPLALYESFRRANQKFLVKNEKLLLSPHLERFKKLPDTPLFEYDHLEKAAEGQYPYAEYLVFVLENRGKKNEISESRKEITRGYLKSAAKSGYQPAMVLNKEVSRLEEEKKIEERKRWQEFILFKEKEIEISTLMDTDSAIRLLEEEEEKSESFRKRKFNEIN